MTLEVNKIHQKHTSLARPITGEFGRHELAILGTDCTTIKQLADVIIEALSSNYKLAYVDADHKGLATDEAAPVINSNLVRITDKIDFVRADFNNEQREFKITQLLNETDLVIINGNHFIGKSQVVVIDNNKPLEKKLDKLTDVRLILIKDEVDEVPAYLKSLDNFSAITILNISDSEKIIRFFIDYCKSKVAPINGLVLIGGKSTRMGEDKGSLNYFGEAQKARVYNLLGNYCQATFISCNNSQALSLKNDFKIIEDSFLNLGPLGGILSAFKTNPNVAWLTDACDMPLLTDETIEYLVRHRNPSKVATAFYDAEGKFPEPLITIWEPKSYSALLQFLAMGYSCPRKVLINSDVQLLQAPYPEEFRNVNTRLDFEEVVEQLRVHQ